VLYTRVIEFIPVFYIIVTMAMEKILLAEDDVFFSSLLVRSFQTEGYDIQAVFDGAQVLEKVTSWEPDLLLLDLLMPNKTGYEVLAALRADQKTVKVPVVVILSNLSQPDDVERAKKLDVAGYFIKANTTPHELVGKIKAIISPKTS
jgi:CheY-like chemotaxis protein